MAVRVSLPSDIYLQILLHLDISEVLIIRRVCKEFLELSNSRAIWRNCLQKRVIDPHIPIPGLKDQTIDSLPPQDLERAVYRALDLRRNWHAEIPLIKNEANFSVEEPVHVVSLNFVRNGARSLLVSLRMYTNPRPRIFHLQAWDLEDWPPKCIAQREVPQGEVRGIAMSSFSGKGEAIAVMSNGLSLEVLGLDSASQDGFSLLRSLEAPAQPIQFLSGSLALMRNTHHPNLLRLLDISNGQTDFELQSRTTEPLRDAIITDEFVVALKGTSLEFYALSRCAEGSRQGTLEPVQTFQWPWRVDHAKMTQHPLTTGANVNTSPINIMIRFGSYFPWSINLLHRYELRTNPGYDPSSVIDQGNMPYDLPPVLQETIASPIRLHATTDMVLGPYGTAVWIDSHTEDYFNHADRGQRLAGRFCPVKVDGSEEIELSDQVATAKASSVYAVQEDDSWVQVAIDEVEGRIAVGSAEKIMVMEYI